MPVEYKSTRTQEGCRTTAPQVQRYIQRFTADYRPTNRHNMKAVAVFLLVLCTLPVSNAWTCTDSPKLYDGVQVDAALGQVVVRDKDGYARYMIGTCLPKMSELKFKHITIGSVGIWGTSTSNEVYKFMAGEFVKSSDRSMEQVDAGGNGQLVGIASNRAYCMTSPNPTTYDGVSCPSWTPLPSSFSHISCGPYGCWATDSNDRIFFTKSLVPTTCSIGDWTQIGGAAKTVEVGTDGRAFVVNAGGNVYERTGISASLPQGTDWYHISMSMSIQSAAYDLNKLWVVSSTGLLSLCTP